MVRISSLGWTFVALVIFLNVSTAVGMRSPAITSPSRVLVLYNADWVEDVIGSETGQDSREVAEYYVRRWTDPITGDQPYLLGLRCIHSETHLNHAVLQERSADNRSGVVCAKVGSLDGTAWLHDSRRVEIQLGRYGGNLDATTLRVEVRSLSGGAAARVAVADGQPVRDPAVKVDNTKDGRVVRLNARAWFPGAVRVSFQVQRNDGTMLRGSQDYFDALDVRPSRTGPDGVRDDLHVLEDVDLQVKDFLEDPANARPDGTLLKDHVLYIVISYGLPRTTVFRYGIARGATERPNDHGTAAALGQRLGLLYADVESLMDFRVGPMKFSGGGPFTRWVYRTGLARQMLGGRINPYLHPWAFQKEKRGRCQEGVAFNGENRARFGRARHLYSVLRVDGPSPDHAKALVDNAVYASRYLSPRLGRPTDPQAKGRAESWRDLYGAEAATGRRRGKRSHTGLLRPGEGFWGKLATYLPGAIDHQVISNNVVGSPRAAVSRMLDDNVTFTGGGAGWSPHITNLSWWDGGVLWPLLLSGHSLGDALQQARMYQGWITSYFGDPLFTPNQAHVVPDRKPPVIAQGCRVEVYPGCLSYMAKVDCEVANSLLEPEVVQLRATLVPEGGGEAKRAEKAIFLARPSAVVHGLEPNGRYATTVELQDPFGNSATWQGEMIETGPALVCNADRVDSEKLAKAGPPALRLSRGKASHPSLDQGQLDLSFTFRGGDRLKLIQGEAISLEWRDGVWIFRAGGSVAAGEHLMRGDQHYRLRARWSESPLLREFLLWDDSEFRIVAVNNRVPWKKYVNSDRLKFDSRRVVWSGMEVCERPE